MLRGRVMEELYVSARHNNSTAGSPVSCRHFVLTGYRTTRRHAILMHGRRLWLTSSCFLAATDLVLARLTTRTGYTDVPSCCGGPEGTRLIIHRLRRALSEAVRGESIITSDGNTRYMLHITPECLCVDTSFFELPTPAFIARETMEKLRVNCWCNVVELAF